MFDYFKKSLARKKARRIFQEYGFTISQFGITGGTVDFANWDNPLVSPKSINQAEIDFYARSVKPGSLALDIGANIGDTTVPMALAAGKSGLVIALEPNPVVYKILRANAQLNSDLVNIITLPYAASEKDEDFSYISSEASFANGGITSGEDSRGLGKYVMKSTVTGINLQAYLLREYSDKLPDLNLIKVDTEGFDLIVLRSLDDLIRKYHPVILAEVFGGITDNERLEMFDFISGLGYQIYNLGDFNAYDSMVEINKRDDMLSVKGNFNVYCSMKK